MAPTRYPSGVTNAGPSQFGAAMISPDPTKLHQYFNDFDAFASADWVITTAEAGAGSATEALTAGDGGLLLITNAAGDNDNDFLQLAAESFKFATGKKMWFKARIAVNEVIQSDVVVGLQITDSSPLAVSDGVYFISADGAATVDAVVVKDSAATTASAVATLVAGTMIDLGFYYNGKSAVEVWVDGVKVATMAATNLPDDEDLAISFGVQNGEAVVKTLTVDYVFASKER